jgi:hypothetical protein
MRKIAKLVEIDSEDGMLALGHLDETFVNTTNHEQYISYEAGYGLSLRSVYKGRSLGNLARPLSGVGRTTRKKGVPQTLSIQLDSDLLVNIRAKCFTDDGDCFWVWYDNKDLEEVHNILSWGMGLTHKEYLIKIGDILKGWNK